MTRDMLSRRRVGTLLFSTHAVLAGTSRLALIEYAGTCARREEETRGVEGPPRRAAQTIDNRRDLHQATGSCVWVVSCLVGRGGEVVYRHPPVTSLL